MRNIEVFLLETIYFLIVSGICVLIYYRTREIYRISRHQGIRHFRNIFFYFAIAYIFRFIEVSFLIYRNLLSARFPGFHQLILIPITYFSSMAIFSIIAAIFISKIKSGGLKMDAFMHIASISFALFSFMTRSHADIIILQTSILSLSIVYIILRNRDFKAKNAFGKKKAIYYLLFVFWVLNLITLDRRALPFAFDIIVYLACVLIFFSIYRRVKKRLCIDGKEKGPS